jgi:N-acetylglucosaminyldiphosphoundecaprenol N-acetyl-beta-D-mannosaminyltransferase
LNIPDGVGVLWAAWFSSLKFSKNYASIIPIFLTWLGSILLIPFYPRLFREPLPERIPGSDFIWPIVRLAAEKKYRVFLLGGAPTIAERVALKLQTVIPDLRIAGVHSGGPKESEEIVECINKSRADIVIVAFGAPKQEKWLHKYLPKTYCKIGIGLGGTFDFIAGTRKRAPIFFQKTGLEWLYRLIQEPKRIKRQLAIPILMGKVLAEKIKHNLKY